MTATATEHAGKRGQRQTLFYWIFASKQHVAEYDESTAPFLKWPVKFFFHGAHLTRLRETCLSFTHSSISDVHNLADTAHEWICAEFIYKIFFILSSKIGVGLLKIRLVQSLRFEYDRMPVSEFVIWSTPSPFEFGEVISVTETDYMKCLITGMILS